MSPKVRRAARVIRNRGQAAALDRGYSARLLARHTGVNPAIAHRWLEGLAIPDAPQRVRLESELEVPQVMWLIPATEAEQQHAIPVPLDEASAVIPAGIDPFAHVPAERLPTYRELREQALLGTVANVYRAGSGRPVASAELPSPFDQLRRLVAVELWLLNRMHDGDPPLELVAARCDAIMPLDDRVIGGQSERDWLDEHPDYQAPPFLALTGRAELDEMAQRSVKIFAPLNCWNLSSAVSQVGDAFG